MSFQVNYKTNTYMISNPDDYELFKNFIETTGQNKINLEMYEDIFVKINTGQIKTLFSRKKGINDEIIQKINYFGNDKALLQFYESYYNQMNNIEIEHEKFVNSFYDILQENLENTINEKTKKYIREIEDILEENKLEIIKKSTCNPSFNFEFYIKESEYYYCENEVVRELVKKYFHEKGIKVSNEISKNMNAIYFIEFFKKKHKKNIYNK